MRASVKYSSFVLATYVRIIAFLSFAYLTSANDKKKKNFRNNKKQTCYKKNQRFEEIENLERINNQNSKFYQGSD